MTSSRELEALQSRAIATIKPLIPADSKERVERAVRQFNQKVREGIRAETGLRLSGEDGKGSVSIRIVDGFPTEVAKLIDRHQDQTLWRLIMAQPKLGGAIEGLGVLIEHWDEFERWLELPEVAKGSKPQLVRAAQVADAMQKLAVARKVFDEIKQIEVDILGLYRLGDSSVDIYWMAHALIAAMLEVRIEDLSVVTLAHELAHAYTHVGRDIDGVAWGNEAFASSAIEVKEGLAQTYAAAVSGKLLNRAPGVVEAYEQLLKHQSEPYRVHLDWLKEQGAKRAEVVRFAMLRARRMEKVDHVQWQALLKETTASLKGKKETSS
ncbi:MAG: hypothetical protein A3H91_10605 [Gammaproteobacteria bacterium RIFCSPLOWO2_02_FULL_61_13]|nr:MAG: hypothetical protein A3H91_10605 [Gammaproteobacteria bacterium RIFCSPLOWO2_02_FULL_61_13]